MTVPAPYPSDTRAKGWRFEIDYEKVEQSDTWSLAAEVPMAQPALLMMWLMAWKEAPCGSLPNDENLIRAKCRIPQKFWSALSPVLMRGWWAADDGRLYHDTLALRVGEMLEYRSKEAERRNKNRKQTPPVPDMSRGTTSGHTGESPETPGTGTGTPSSLRSEEIPAGKYPADFELVWAEYPKRPGASKPDAHKAWAARVKAGVSIAVLHAGVVRYAAYCRVCKTEPGFIKQPATFFGPGEHYTADWTAHSHSNKAPTGNKFTAAAAGIFSNPQHAEVIDV